MTDLIRLDAEGIDKIERMLAGIKNGAPRAITRALNDTSNKAKTRGIEEARLDVRLTATYLREQIKSAKDTPANKATFTNQVSKVTARQRGIQMGRYVTNFSTVGFGFPDRPPRTKVKPSGASTQWPNGFLLPIGGGTGVGLFTRDGAGLDSRYGPSPSQIWKSEKDVIAPEMAAFLADNINKQVQSILRQSLAGQL